jgi:hypothetical protein
MTGINITLVQFALEQNFDFLRISQGGVTRNVDVPPLPGTSDNFTDFSGLLDEFYNVTGYSTDNFTDLPAQRQVPFTLGPGDVTIEFTSDGRGLHSFTLQLNLSCSYQ